MEVKINREIRQYTESVFFGLSARQFIFSVLAVLSAIGLYFWLEPALGAKSVSWICILGAVPFAFLGFFRYHGLTAEKFVIAWLRSEVLGPKKLLFKPDNLYLETVKQTIQKREKEMRKEREDKQEDREGTEDVSCSEESAGSRTGEEDMAGRDLFMRKRDIFENLDIL